MKSLSLHVRRSILASATALVVLGHAAVSSGITVAYNEASVYTGFDVNTALGANVFYQNGYTGSRAVVVMENGGYAWNGQESLTRITTYLKAPGYDGTSLGTTDDHDTACAYFVGGAQTANGGVYQKGIAYGATLWSGAVATSFGTNEYFSFDGPTDAYPVQTAFITGINGTKADVSSASFGGPNDLTNSPQQTFIDAFDAMYGKSQAIACYSAGNDGAGTNVVEDGGSLWNSITVGAAHNASPSTGAVYNSVTAFSSQGPSSFLNPVTNVITPNVRAAVTLIAPGDWLSAASFGATIDNAQGNPSYVTNAYSFANGGTSFACPIAAGAAALIVDAGKANFTNPNSWQLMVVKSVMMNSADKIPGWDNGQTIVNGVLTTTQALDYTSGAGELNIGRAYTQYLGGTTDVPGLGGGAVKPIGWDYGHVDAGIPNKYSITQPLKAGQTLSATLDWTVAASWDGTYAYSTDAGELVPVDAELDHFSNLDLEIWDTNPLTNISTEVAVSDALYNNVQELYYTIPSDGQYSLQIDFDGTQYGTATGEDYGLAWSASPVPEPASLSLIAVGASLLLGRRRRHRVHSK